MAWTYELSDLYNPNSAPIKYLRFSPDGALLASADVRRNVRVHKGAEVVYEHRFRSAWDRLRALDHVRGMEFDRQSNLLYLASGNMLRSIDLSNGIVKIVGNRRPMFGFLITCPQTIAISGGNELAVGFDDAVIEVYARNGNGMKPKSSWKTSDTASMVGFLPAGNMLVASDRYTVAVYDTDHGAQVARLQSPKVFAMATSPTENVIALHTLDKVSIWQVDTGTLLGEVRAERGLPTLAFSRDGQLLAVGDATGATIYNLDGAELHRYDSDSGQILSMTFSPVEDILAVGGSEGKINLVDVRWAAVKR